MNSIIIASIIVLVFHFVLVIKKYGELPQQVPIHFDIAGNPDNWGTKAMSWMLPSIAVVVLVIMWFARSSGRINTPIELEPKTMLQVLDHLSLSCQMLFLALSYLSIEVALGNRKGLGKSFFFFFLVVILYPFLFMLKGV